MRKEGKKSAAAVVKYNFPKNKKTYFFLLLSVAKYREMFNKMAKAVALWMFSATNKHSDSSTLSNEAVSFMLISVV